MGKQDKPRIRVKPLSTPGSADKPPAAPPSSSRKRDRSTAASPPGPPPPLVPPPDVLEMRAREAELVEEHRAIEVQIYELESKYLSTSNPYGNAVKGYAGLSLETAGRSKRGAIKADDRLFSRSSLTGQLPTVTGGLVPPAQAPAAGGKASAGAAAVAGGGADAKQQGLDSKAAGASGVGEAAVGAAVTS